MPLDLEPILARLHATTAGHWNADYTDDEFEPRKSALGGLSARISTFTPGDILAPNLRVGEFEFDRKEDVEFVIHAKADIEALLVRVLELEDMVRRAGPIVEEV